MKTNKDYYKVRLGIVDKQSIYLSPPSWDCGWYWGFGYLGNKNCHYHVDTIDESVNLKNALDKHFGDSYLIIPSLRWTFAELFRSFYYLKRTAEVLGKGGSHLASNPCSEIIKNETETIRINKDVLPAIFDEIYKIIDKSIKFPDLCKELKEIEENGTTKQSVEWLMKNEIKLEDIEN